MNDTSIDIWAAGKQLLDHLDMLGGSLRFMLMATDDLQRPAYWREGAPDAVESFAADAWALLAGLREKRDRVQAAMGEIDTIQAVLVHAGCSRGHAVHGDAHLTALEAAVALAGTVLSAVHHLFLAAYSALAEAADKPPECPSANLVACLLAESELPERVAAEQVGAWPPEAQRTFWRHVADTAQSATRPVSGLVVALQRERHVCKDTRTPGGGSQSRKPAGKRGRPKDRFTQARAEHAKRHVEGDGQGWKDAFEAYRQKNPDDTDLNLNAYRKAYERVFPLK